MDNSRDDPYYVGDGSLLVVDRKSWKVMARPSAGEVLNYPDYCQKNQDYPDDIEDVSGDSKPQFTQHPYNQPYDGHKNAKVDKRPKDSYKHDRGFIMKNRNNHAMK